MSVALDPRTKGFNYNGEWNGRKPAMYKTAVKIAYLLARQAAALDEQAWDLEMAIKDVRTSSPGEERTDALADLARELAKHLPHWKEDQ